MVLISPLNQHLQPIFQHEVTGSRILAKTITEDTPLCDNYDLARLILLISNLNLHNETLLGINNFYDEFTLALTASIKKSSKPILHDLQFFDHNTPMFDYLVPT